MIKYYIPLKSDIRPSRMDYAPIFSTKLLFQIWNEGLSFAVNLGKRSFPPPFQKPEFWTLFIVFVSRSSISGVLLN